MTSSAEELATLAPDVETLARRMAGVDYLVDEGLATAIFLSLRLPQPLLLEGEAGVGKTEAATSLAAALDTPLIRLQCYEGIDAAEALYEWNYPRQLLSIRLAEAGDEQLSEDTLFGPDYLIRRPLLRALEHPGPRPAVLLIDEIDRADDDFEAFLLELLGEARVTIPELGTVTATHPPAIVLTSNRTRDLHDAVKRRCLYHRIGYPSAEREVEIIRRRVKGAAETLAVQVADAVSRMRESDVQKPPGIAEAIDWVAALQLLGVESLDAAAADRTLGSVLKYDEDQEVIRAAGLDQLCAPVADFGVTTLHLDLPPLAGALSTRLREESVPVTPDRAAGLAHALTLVEPVSRRRLYWTARAALVSDEAQVAAFNRVFAEVFGDGAGPEPIEELEQPLTEPAPPDERPSGEGEGREVDVPMALASDEERLATKSFDALEPHELTRLYRLMARLELATPLRQTRRRERARHGHETDLRRTLRGSLRTGGEPIHLARRRRRVLPRRLVMLCDISGSMEPYARAYLQFLTCAAAAGPNAEAFVFATRLTRVTRALGSRRPEQAIQRAAAAAPDWSSGTRIGKALKAFNDHHGRRGMARGAVVVILSDGWERGDPALVGTQMERLSRLAHRIIWVNPRVAAGAFSAEAGGMRAALPHCDSLVSGHSFDALTDVVDAIGGRDTPPPEPQEAPEQETWASATPVPGSSVAMPSGYGPSRGNTTPGWSIGGEQR